MLNVKTVVNGAWQDVDFFYPLKFSKKLNLEFDSGSYNTLTQNEASIEPYQLVKIETDNETLYYYATPSEEWKPTINQMSYELVEVSKELTGIFLDGVASTNLIGQTKTLLQVVDRLLKITPLRREGQAQKYAITTNSAVMAKLGKNAPEFRWSAQTSLWEALVDIGACIDAIPRLTAVSSTATVCDVITFDFVNATDETESINDYIGRLRGVNEEQYCSEIETNVQNLVSVDESEGDIYYPSSNAFITPRTQEVKLTDQNCELILTKPIADVDKLEYLSSGIMLQRYTFDYVATTNDYQKRELTDISLESVIGTNVVDLSSRLVDLNEWQTLPTTEGGSGNTGIWSKYKESTFYYQRYGNTVTLQNGKVKGAFDIFATNVWQLVLNGALMDTLKYWERGQTATVVGSPDYSTAYYDENGNPYWISLYLGYFTTVGTADLMNCQFRLKYKPISPSIKVRAKKDKETNFNFIQPYTQRAEIVNSTAYGKHVETTTNRMGVETQTIVDFATSWSDLKNIGDAYNGYIITAIDYNVIGKNAIECVYSVSKDWSYLSQWFSIDKKYRSWNMPTDNITRNLYYADTMIVGDSVSEEQYTASLGVGGVNKLLSVMTSTAEVGTEVNNMTIEKWREYAESEFANIVIASSFAFGKSVAMHGEMLDNLSAGVKRQNGTSTRYNLDSYYTEDDGTLEKARIVFGSRILNLNANELPGIKGSTNKIASTDVILQDLLIYKDAGEKITCTYQLNSQTNRDDIFIGDAFFARNPLVRERTSNAVIKLCGFVNEPTDISTMDVLPGTAEDTGLTVTVNKIDITNEPIIYAGSLQVPTIPAKYKGWALCETVDGVNRLLVASNINKNAPDTVHFSFVHKN